MTDLPKLPEIPLLTRGDLEAISLRHGVREGDRLLVGLSPACHSDRGVRAFYDARRGVVLLSCDCGIPIVAIPVAWEESAPVVRASDSPEVPS